MDFVSLMLIAVSLAADCFAVAVSTGVSLPAMTYRPVLRTASAFGVAQFSMPVIGWLAGRTVVDIMSGFDHWVAFGLLGLVGSRMVWEWGHPKGQPEKTADATRGMLLVTLAVATSIDALAVGLGFAFMKLDILISSATIGAVAFVITILGFVLGRRAGAILGGQAKLVGGVILIGIGLRILVSHITG